MMQMRTLGTDLNVSAVGLGCMGFSHAYGAPTEEAGVLYSVDKEQPKGCSFFISQFHISDGNRQCCRFFIFPRFREF